MSSDSFPPLIEYVLAHRCPTCRADPGADCDAPRKNAGLARLDRMLKEMGQEPVEHDRVKRQHAPRVDAGIAHRGRDVSNAPCPKERVPGKRYDTIGKVASKPRRPATPGKDMPPADAPLHVRGVYVFGASGDQVRWPYGLEDPQRRFAGKDIDQERFDTLREHARAAQETVTAWALRYGLKESSAHTDCLAWLQRETSQSCTYKA